MKNKDIVIAQVISGSIAQELGVEPGDKLISINGEKIFDVFDYRFYATDENILVQICKKDDEVWELEIEKDAYEDIGIEFETGLIDEPKSCTNKCIFCFIDQLPKGLRETLYFKDDDSRLSFLTGNYVTLTNMKKNDIDRIIKYKMSPVNVSVHTTNAQLRVKMLGNRFAKSIIQNITRLTEAGIEVNTQIVLCRGINDGIELDRTIKDLSSLYPQLRSISVVPVGITRFREGLTELIPYDKISAQNVVEQVSDWQKRLKLEYDSSIVFIADEFYIMSETEVPDSSHYEDFPQIENGVGLTSSLLEEFDEYLKTLECRLTTNKYENTNTNADQELSSTKKRCVSIATGVLIEQHIKTLALRLEEVFPDIKVQVYAIKNHFFGESVTVAGLLTGQDIIKQLKNEKLGDKLLICSSMLREGYEVFLDNTTVEDVELQLNIKVETVQNSGEDFINNILER